MRKTCAIAAVVVLCFSGAGCRSTSNSAPPVTNSSPPVTIGAVMGVTEDGTTDQGVAYPILELRSPSQDNRWWTVEALILTDHMGTSINREVWRQDGRSLALGVAGLLPYDAETTESLSLGIVGILRVGTDDTGDPQGGDSN